MCDQRCARVCCICGQEPLKVNHKKRKRLGYRHVHLQKIEIVVFYTSSDVEYIGLQKVNVNIILLDKTPASGDRLLNHSFTSLMRALLNLSQTAFHKVRHCFPNTDGILLGWWCEPQNKSTQGAHFLWYLHKAPSWGQHKSSHLLTNCLRADSL